MSSSQQISVLVAIDTEYIKKNFPNASQDPDHPTGINHASQYMLCTGSRGILSGQGTADLSFKANPGDDVSFTGISLTANSDDAVIVYGIKYWSGDKVFNKYEQDLVVRSGAVQPDPDSAKDNGLPPLLTKQSFASYTTKVRNAGKENFYVYIALYTLADDGETQVLKGYYYWDPTITVG